MTQEGASERACASAGWLSKWGRIVPAGLIVVALAVLALGVSAAVAQQADGEVFAPLPEAPEVDQAKADLGRLLFFDTRLSGDTASACATCHAPDLGWGDGMALSNGYTSVLYFRNAPGLFNVAHRNFFMWEGRLDGADLPTVVRDMITESHTMQMDSRLMQERLKQIPEYAEAFQSVFGTDPYGGRIYSAIAEYLKTIRTVDAPFDLFLRGNDGALSAEARRGMEVFAGKANCTACHSGSMLSDGGRHATGVPDHPALAQEAERQITMLRFFATMGTPNYMNLRQDVGAYVVSKDAEDIGRFATPSLWDVGQTAPYMHSGVFETLAEVVDFYDAGTESLPPLDLTDEEKGDLIAFLESLTGAAPDASRPELPAYQVRTRGEN